MFGGYDVATVYGATCSIARSPLHCTIGSKAKKLVSRLHQDRFNGEIECEYPQPSLAGAFKVINKIMMNGLLSHSQSVLLIYNKSKPLEGQLYGLS